MGTASAIVMILAAMVAGIAIGVSGIYMDVIPNSPAELLEVKLEGSQERVSKLDNINDDLEQELEVMADMMDVLDSSMIQSQKDLENTEERLTQVQSEKNSLVVEVADRKSRLESLQRQITILEDEIGTANYRVKEVEIENLGLQTKIDILNDFVNERDAILSAISALNKQIADLNHQNKNLVDQRDAFKDNYGRAQSNYNSLKSKWDLWQKHASLAPQARSDIELIGFIPEAGNWDIEETAIIITFPDPENCIRLGRTVGTQSMRPAMGGGHSFVETTCFDKTSLRAGDIISFQSNVPQSDESIEVLHQIVEVRTNGVVTKGINNDLIDPSPVSWDDILGLVVVIIY